jgi:hypothetical protein
MKKFLLPVLALFALNASAQKASKKPLDHLVYDSWQSIANDRISNDGEKVMYVVKPQQGDADLVITNIKNTRHFHIPRADTARFTSDSRFALALIRPFYKDVRQAKIKKKKPAEFPKDTLAIIVLEKNTVEKIPAIRSFKMADRASVVAYLAPADTVKKPEVSDTFKKAVATTIAPPTRDGAELTLRQLHNGKSRTFKYVSDYVLSKKESSSLIQLRLQRSPKMLRPGFSCTISRRTLYAR